MYCGISALLRRRALFLRGPDRGAAARCFGAQEAECFHARTTADDKRGSKRVIRLLPAACCLLRIQTLRSGESGCRCGPVRLILLYYIRAPPSACSAQHRLCACASILSAFRLCGNRSFRMPNRFLLSSAPSPETAESRGCVLLSAVRRFLPGGNGAGCCEAVCPLLLWRRGILLLVSFARLQRVRFPYR